jgi:uncharacterized integral membrane protein (TIGR00697 family)
VVVFVANQVPADVHSLVSQGAFAAVFGFTPGILVGSMVAYVVSQLIDVYLFDLLRRVTRGKYLWLRNNVATLTGQLFDTAIFAAIAWVLYPLVDTWQQIEPITWDAWYQITRNEYGLKVVFTFLNIPLTYAGVYGIRRLIRLQ